MAQVNSYSIYCLYTEDNKIYIGMTGINVEVRIYQHFYKSCNFRLRKLFDDPKTKVFSRVLYRNLTQLEANELEKKLIKEYRNNPDYEILNIQSGGLRGNNKITKPKKVWKREKHKTDDEILKLRLKYSNFKNTFDIKEEAIKNNMSHKYFIHILKGQARYKVGGPLLGKDYINGSNS